MELPHLPPPVRILKDFLADRTGTEAVITKTKRTVVLTHGNERVRLTVTFALGGPHIRGVKAWVQTASTLEIDGKPSPLAEDEDEYVKVFKGECLPTGEEGPDAGGIPEQPTTNIRYRTQSVVTKGKAKAHW